MMSKSAILILALTLVAISSAAVQGRPTLVGGRMHIGHVTANKEVQELGRFSVDHYNRSDKLSLRLPGVDGEEAPLRFVRVVEAERQVVAGIKYFLKVEALQGGERRVFDAEVVVKPWLPTSPKQLISFSPSTKHLN